MLTECAVDRVRPRARSAAAAAATAAAGSELLLLRLLLRCPQDESSFAAWRRELLPAPQVRANRSALAGGLAALAGRTSAGFKMRPYTLSWWVARKKRTPLSAMSGRVARLLLCVPASWAAQCPAAHWGTLPSSTHAGLTARALRRRGGNNSHTAATGVSPEALRALLQRHNVSVVLTLRRNRLKEALSWYKARALGVQQFAGRPRGGGDSGAGGGGGSGGGSGDGRGFEGSEAGASQQQVVAASSPVSHPPIQVDISSLLNWLNYTDHVNERLLEATRYLGRPTLTIWCAAPCPSWCLLYPPPTPPHPPHPTPPSTPHPHAAACFVLAPSIGGWRQLWQSMATCAVHWAVDGTTLGGVPPLLVS